MTPARYLVFGGSIYYAAGGANDLLSSHARLEDAIAHGRARLGTPRDPDWLMDTVDWWHVYDTHEARIVAGTRPQGYGAPNIEGGEEP